jgi:BolA family transcriptional regulator, general stress-responsive regulator
MIAENSAHNIGQQIKNNLEQALQPIVLELADDSAHHHGHPEATARGGRHYKLKVVATIFEDMPRLARERRVQNAIKKLWDAGQIHALSCKLYSPSEWAKKAEK